MCCILITKSQNTPIECTHYLFSIFMGIRMFIVSSGVLRVYEQHWVSYKKQELHTLGSNWVHPQFFCRSVLLFVLD